MWFRQRTIAWVLIVSAGLGIEAIAQLADPDQVIDKEKMKPKGLYYEARVPDTLDLAERARAAINALTGNLDPDRSYGVYQRFRFGNPPEMGGLTWNLPAKNARALPYMRTMSGSTQNLDIEFHLMHSLISQIRDDGLAYVPIDNDGAPKDTAYPYAVGLIALAVLNWYERDGNTAWLDYVNSLTKGLQNIAIRVEDRAYYPPESSYKPDGTWAWTLRGEARIPYVPPEEPYLEQQGLEGCVKYEQSAPLRVLVRHYDQTKDAETRELLGRCKRFMLKSGMWEDTSQQGYPGNEHGTFAGHFHGNMTSLHALLELAIATDDDWLKQFVREAYDHARRTGVIRMGWFPGWLKPEAHHRSKNLFLASETCGVSDMLLLAVKLTDAGLGDYWYDVDAIVRNHLTAQQFPYLEEMRKMAGGGHEHDELLKRFVGGFNQQMEGWVSSTAPHVWGCCTANGSMGLYYAWHAITRYQDGVATVNLFLNRASDWMDIDSYLPYEGKVVLHNKKAHTALVRLPHWLERDQTKAYLDDQPINPTMSGPYLLFEKLDKGTLRLEFPVPETTDRYTIGDREYTLKFRGSTLMDITPRSGNPAYFEYYSRKDKSATKAPMHTVTRFAAKKVLRLQ